MKIHDLLSEALKLSQAKPYVKAWNPNFHKEVFEREPNKDKHAYRIYLPFETGQKNNIKIPEALQAYLSTAIPNKPYTTDQENYMQGLAYEIANPTRKLGIGKMLARSESQTQDVLVKSKLQSLKRAFDADPQRAATKKEGKMIVISRHPYDIAGMSTDRGWLSCMNIVDGSNKRYVIKDVKQGSIIAYLVNANDVNINKPLARILIKPYQEKGNPSNIIMMGDAVYGTAPSEFKTLVDAWINKNYNKDKSGFYCIAPGLYRDKIPERITILNDKAIESMNAIDLIKIAKGDQKLWPRIAQIRPDADEILLQLAKTDDSDAATYIKNVNMPGLKQAVQKNSAILKYLHTQPPELIEIALRVNPDYVIYVKNRSAAQNSQVNKIIKNSPQWIGSVSNPTPEQVLIVLDEYYYLLSWVLENHPQVLTAERLIKILRHRVKDEDVSYSTLNELYNFKPEVFDDPKLIMDLIKHMPSWIIDTQPLTPQLVQKLVLHAPDSRYIDEDWLEDHVPKIKAMLQQLPKSEQDPKLRTKILKSYPELLSVLPDVSDDDLIKYVKKTPTLVNFMEDPSPEVAYQALLNDESNDVFTDGFNKPKYMGMWKKLINQDPTWIENLKPAPDELLRLAARHKDMDYYDAVTILRKQPKASMGTKVMLIKAHPRAIGYIDKPPLALQMAAITANPDAYNEIRSKDRHPAAKAYMAAYRKEMRKPE